MSNGGARIPGKAYNERWYNPYKISGFGLLESTLVAEQCFVRLNQNSRYDAILFVGAVQTGLRYRVVTRLDEFGNMDANLTEVTFEASSKAEKKTPRLVSLAEAVQAVVHHQIATGSYPSDEHMVTHPSDSVNTPQIAKATKSILHVVPGLNEPWNGIARAAKDIAAAQGADCVETREFLRSSFIVRSSSGVPYDEVWVHSNWWLPTLMACWRVIRAGLPLVRMTHANLDPLRYQSKGWKKRLVAPIERWLYRRTARVVVTCETERDWCRAWGVRCPIEVYDLKRFFKLGVEGRGRCRKEGETLHVLYLGRPHPLKGVEFLRAAIKGLEVELHEVSDHLGDELEADWAWSDVLCLPTLSENFGLVVAEALERGKRVITTDGAPAWEGQIGVIYLKGYREGTDAERVRLLKDALEGLERVDG